ncbi:MAG TPA: SH3 domain-containing protein [Leptospiraceae bacterium]|nr:SH3 domain-containing protein [Leptospiraceae bacterium]HNF16535.1 SH3 domain-containing protein [Leptospiraceae bacterium]HNN05986.1 SH3 domain-containing protein [Leptospiraceae bacterium]
MMAYIVKVGFLLSHFLNNTVLFTDKVRQIIYVFVILCISLFGTVDAIYTQELEAYALENGVNVRSEPSIQSKIVGQLKIADFLTISKYSNKTVVNGLLGKWVYVERIEYKIGKTPLHGWVFDYYLGYKSAFQNITGCKFQDIYARASNGEHFIYYKFEENCKFTKYLMPPGYQQGGPEEPTLDTKGTLIMLKNVILAKKSTNGDITGIFFINKNNGISYNMLY